MNESALPGRLVFVGTGGGAQVLRCHASYALELSPDETLLLDAAGGFVVVRQLRSAAVDLAAIRYIFISHRHSDHVNGLEPLLLHIGLHAQRTTRCAGEIRVLAHPAVVDAAQTLIRALASSSLDIIRSRDGHVRWVGLEAGEPVDLRPGLRLTPFAVDHAPSDGSALGCVVEFAFAGRTRRVVYSGDTRPTAALETRAANADILLHEAGGLDAESALVHAVGHTTAGEVGRLATRCGARGVYLVHLPDESCVAAYRDEVRQHYGGAVTVPDDLASYTFSELFLRPTSTP
jgi:ribonuclease BN (tRNA processing enzyme)